MEGLPWLQQLQRDFHRGIEEGIHAVIHDFGPPFNGSETMVNVFRYFRQSAIVRAWGSFEGLAEDLWIGAPDGTKKPKSFRSYGAIERAYTEACPLGAPPFANAHMLRILSLMRHVIVHRGGYVDAPYLDSLDKLEVEVEAKWAADWARLRGTTEPTMTSISKPCMDYFRGDVGAPLDFEVDQIHTYIEDIGREGHRLIKLVGCAVKGLSHDYRPKRP